MRAIKLVLALGLTAIASVASASDAGAGYVYGIYAMPNGAVLFNHTGSRQTPPSCGAGLPTRWAFDGSTAAGQARLALLMTAYALHKQISINGTGACPDWGDTETANWFATAGDG